LEIRERFNVLSHGTQSSAIIILNSQNVTVLRRKYGISDPLVGYTPRW